MRHFKILGLSLTLTLGLVACGNSGTSAPSSSDPGIIITTANYSYNGSILILTEGEQVRGTYLPGATWTSGNPEVASVSAAADGSFTVIGNAAGSAELRATAGSHAAVLKVTVNAAATSTVTGVKLNASSLNLTAGSSQTVTASVQGSGSINPAVSWSSSNAEVATVDGTGRVTGVAQGSATITARSVQDPSKKASLTVNVTSAAPDPLTGSDPFNITVIFPANSNLTETQKAAFTSAANRWSQVIAAGLPDVPNVRLSTGETVTVDDVTIVASGVAIDGPGNVLGQAGPRQVRNGTTLPLWGEMQFDSADLANMEANGTLQGVVLHEMGHVLGIGTLWDRSLSANASPCENATQVQYLGASGLREYRNLGGLAAGVPVENQYGEGTKCAHWKESVFQSELMTGFASRGPMPLSRLTLGALADLGYSVNYAAADPYTIPNVGAQSLGQEIKERLITPNGIINP
ncbi:Ig-like domain-containing protein [Deinococcus geothermalis]|uniref:Ig-like domain-containing protein n=1 Tax=Deinococcus geothermalis TaxID=68909 RepID=UPI002354D5F0|nr:Ig-like domain-containing protein [Deinococcus geothermalis]